MQISMASNDLESFFLNKDKKKKSKKTNVINPSLLFEQTREAELKKAKKVIEKNQQSQEPKSDLLRKTKEDDEWEDTGDTEVDITNLRIGMMPPKVDEVKGKVEINTETVSDESDSDSNTKKIDKSAHPWGNKVVIKYDTEVVPESSQSGKYVPPSMRGVDLSKTSMKQIKKAPNITNNSEFPSLREVVDNDTEDGTWSKVIKNGHSQTPAQQQQQQQSEHITKKNIPPMKRETIQPEPIPVNEKKYVPPHMRNKQSTGTSENRFAGLKDETMH